MIDRMVPFERFHDEIEAVVLTPAKDKKTSAARKPIDVIMVLRLLVLQLSHNSDPPLSIKCVTRMSFMRFLLLRMADRIRTHGCPPR